MGSENTNDNATSIRDYLPPSPFKRRKELQAQSTAYQKDFKASLLAAGQTILEKVALEFFKTGKIDTNGWATSSELKDFEAKYGPIAYSKLLHHIENFNHNSANLLQFQLLGMYEDDPTGPGYYVQVNIDTVFVRIIDEQGRTCTLNLTELARANSVVKHQLAILALPDQIYVPSASTEISEDIQQFVQVQYSHFLAAQLILEWNNEDSSQILLDFLTASETKQQRNQTFQHSPKIQRMVLQQAHRSQQVQNTSELSDDVGVAIEEIFPPVFLPDTAEPENELPQEQVAESEKSASITATATPIAAPKKDQNTPAPEPQKQKEDGTDNLAQLLRGIFSSAVDFLFGIKVVNIVLEKAGLHDSKTTSEHQGQTATATDKKDNQSHKLSTSFFNVFKSVFTLPAISTNLGESLLENVDIITSRSSPSPRK